MYENLNPHDCDPPGTFREVVAHPSGLDRSIEKAIIMEHRFAFFFWMKWCNALRESGLCTQDSPTLVTIDWHRDLAPLPDDQKTTLEQLDQSNLSDVANYVWAQFAQTNDGHIRCAAWLDLVGDIVLLQNTANYRQATFKDKDGRDHTIYEFQKYKQFEEFLLARNDQHIFLDIDLDYFIHGRGNMMDPDAFEVYSETEIKNVIDGKSPVFRHILPKIDGLTIALEPSYCGGISNSCAIMEVINNQLFDKRNNWRHFKNQ